MANEMAAAAMTARMKLPDVDEKDKPKRRPIPDHILRMQVELTSGADACADCGGRLRRIGEDVTEELEYVPGRFIVNRIVRPRRTCACCETFVQSPLPSRPIERGRPGPGLLAHVLVSKYADHLPLYRQSQIFDREGLDLDRSTLADWVGKSTALLEPLADAIGRHVLSAEAILPTTHRSACWRPVPARPKPQGSGPMRATNAPGVALHSQRPGVGSPATGNASTTKTISPASEAGCMPPLVVCRQTTAGQRMAMPGLKISTFRAPSARSPAWPPLGRSLCNRLTGNACQTQVRRHPPVAGLPHR
jgi:transposase